MLPFKIFDDPIIRRRTDHVFFVGMALTIVAMDVLGFTISFLKTNIASELQSDWVKAHAIVFTAWIPLFLIQTTLVASNRTDLHRKVGIAGVIDCGLIILITIGGAISAFVHSPPRPPLDHFMLHVVVHVDAIDFAILAVAGILFRNRDSEVHKRLMFLATVVLAARFPFLGGLFKTGWNHFIDQDAFFVIGVFYDLITRGRINKAYIWGGLVFVLVPPLAHYSFNTLVPHLVVTR
ncbi:MAG TPA: hypothetical protein VK804_31065 [Bradyrhizobium sp.]|jgi:hypothetical protein|uniref:hypothetical protein n=1 Tax=Bradyrhizobium sp. TaxID=376 RepID=UPI002CDBE4F0|nr:hypothetical protein [Bradyrhizobium sp.]HTB04935.1 hypothetical protein [Bradyrhizobium sp.]